MRTNSALPKAFERLSGLLKQSSHLRPSLQRFARIGSMLERIFITLRRAGALRSAMHAAPFLSRYCRRPAGQA